MDHSDSPQSSALADRATGKDAKEDDARPLFESSTEAWLVLSQNGSILSMNQAARRLFSCEHYSQLHIGKLLPRFSLQLDLSASAIDHQGALPLALKGINQHGSRLPLQLNAMEVATGGPEEPSTVLMALSHFVPSQPLDEELLRQRELQQVTLASICDGIIITDADGRVVTINPAALDILGLSSTGGVGHFVDDLMLLCSEDSKDVQPSLFKQALERGDRVHADSNARLLIAGGEPLPVSAQAAPVRTSQALISGCVITLRDNSEARRLSAKLSWQANHDALTLLPNRSYFESELSRAMDSARFGTASHGLIYVDLYQFQIINDTCGHAAGDDLLKRLSQLFNKVLRSQDLLARLGSDEFGILLRNCTLAGTQRVANLLLRSVEQFVFEWGGRRMTVGISIGAVSIDRESHSDAQVMAAAEASCAAAKEAGRNRIHLYHHHNSQIVERRRNEMHWVAKINDAIAENRLCLYQQAIVPVDEVLRSQETPHFEILVRMKDENDELVMPGHFIPAAERYGLMEDIDRWVVKKVIDYIARREAASLPQVTYAVNLSGPTLGNDSFRDFVLQEMDAAGIEPSSLCFEITETAAVGNFNRAIRFIETFREKGCVFYLDDFGSGMSSFSYLKDLPVDYLKIDGAFIRSMESDSVDFAMVSAINHLAHVMGIKTVAEYVENEAILDLLSGLGVDFAQGFGIAKPAPVHLI